MRRMFLAILAACSSHAAPSSTPPLGYVTSQRAIEWFSLCHEPVKRILLDTGGVILKCGRSVPSWTIVVDRGEITEVAIVGASKSELVPLFDRWGSGLVGKVVGDKLKGSLELGSMAASERIEMNVWTATSVADVRWRRLSE